eukprot:gene5523-2450_t
MMSIAHEKISSVLIASRRNTLKTQEDRSLYIIRDPSQINSILVVPPVQSEEISESPKKKGIMKNEDPVDPNVAPKRRRSRLNVMFDPQPQIKEIYIYEDEGDDAPTMRIRYNRPTWVCHLAMLCFSLGLSLTTYAAHIDTNPLKFNERLAKAYTLVCLFMCIVSMVIVMATWLPSNSDKRFWRRRKEMLFFSALIECASKSSALFAIYLVAHPVIFFIYF